MSEQKEEKKEKKKRIRGSEEYHPGPFERDHKLVEETKILIALLYRETKVMSTVCEYDERIE